MKALNLIFKSIMALLLLGLASCHSSREKENQNKVRINIESDLTTLDPQKARELNAVSVTKMLFDGLVRMNLQDEAELSAAEQVQISEEGKKYTFVLREAKWSNGDEVTAQDFEYAWKRVLRPDFPSDMAYQLYVIKNAKAVKNGEMAVSELGVRALSKHVLEVELEEITPYFLKLLAFPAFFPIHAENEEKHADWSSSPIHYVCNGPFMLDQWAHNDLIAIKKNPRYWDASVVMLDRIEMVMVSTDTEFMMFEKGELDWAGSPLSNISIDLLEEISAKGKISLKPMHGTCLFRVNVSSFPFSNQKIRKAFAYAINRKEIVDHALHKSQIATGNFVPLTMHLANQSLLSDMQHEDIKELFLEGLKELGLNEAPKITLTYGGSSRNHLIAQAVQQQWYQTLGVHVYLEAIESKVVFSRISHLDYQIAIGSWTADFDDPINFLEVFKYKKASTNNTSWESPRYIYLLDSSSKCLDLKQREEYLRESERLLLEELPVIPLFQYNMAYLKNEKLKDAALSALGTIDFKWASIEGETK